MKTIKKDVYYIKCKICGKEIMSLNEKQFLNNAFAHAKTHEKR